VQICNNSLNDFNPNTVTACNISKALHELPQYNKPTPSLIITGTFKVSTSVYANSYSKQQPFAQTQKY